MCPTNGAAASMETFAAALGSGIEENLQSSQLIQPGMHDMRACRVKLIWVESTFKTEEEKKKRSTKIGGRWRILRPVERAALMDSAARRMRALPTFLKVLWNKTNFQSYANYQDRQLFPSDQLVVCLY